MSGFMGILVISHKGIVKGVIARKSQEAFFFFFFHSVWDIFSLFVFILRSLNSMWMGHFKHH